jgi:hypothetical protein
MVDLHGHSYQNPWDRHYFLRMQQAQIDTLNHQDIALQMLDCSHEYPDLRE